jgi:outer membrane lipoprotein-sorting protein
VIGQTKAAFLQGAGRETENDMAGAGPKIAATLLGVCLAATGALSAFAQTAGEPTPLAPPKTIAPRAVAKPAVAAKPATAKPATAKPTSTAAAKPAANKPVASKPAARPASGPRPAVAAIKPATTPAAAGTKTAAAKPVLAGKPRLPNPIRPAQVAQLAPMTPPGAVAARTGGSTAFDANQRALIDKVSAYLSSVNSLTGRFVQVGPDGKRTEGDLYLQKPGKVRFDYAAPSPIELIADGQSVVVRDRKLATQDLYPLSQTPLRFLLANNIDLLRDTTLTAVYADDVFVTVVIEEKTPLVGTNRLMMMFGAKDMQLRQWTVTDPQGYDTTVALYNLDSTKKPDPSLFKINYERVLQ